MPHTSYKDDIARECDFVTGSSLMEIFTSTTRWLTEDGIGNDELRELYGSFVTLVCDRIDGNASSARDCLAGYVAAGT